MKAYVLTLTAAASLAGGYFVYQHALSERPKRSGASKESIENQSEIVKPARHLPVNVAVNDLQQHQPVPGADEEASAETDDAGSAANERSTEPQSTKPGSAPVELVLSTMEATFETEPPDPKWATTTANSIRESATSFLGERAEVRSVECRSSMCRMETVQDREQLDAFVTKFTHSGACSECFYTTTGEMNDGRPVLAMYIARKGGQLPRVE